MPPAGAAAALIDFLFAGDSDDSESPARDIRARGRTAAPYPSTSAPSAAEAPLIARVNAGDRDAFSLIYRDHYAGMWRLAHRLTGSDDIACDVVHDIFLNVWHKRASWAPHATLREYFLRAARNESLRVLAHDAVVHKHAGVVRHTVTSTPAATDDVSVQDDLERAVVRAIAELPERQRSAFLLRWDEELSTAAIGRVLGISDVAAGKLIAKAQRTLRDVLQRFR